MFSRLSVRIRFNSAIHDELRTDATAGRMKTRGRSRGVQPSPDAFSRNTIIEDSSIRTETEPLTERLDCVDRAPIRWGWRRGLREQREAGGACGTLFFSHPPTPSRVFVFDIVHNIVARGARVEG